MSRPGDAYSYGATLYHLASGARPLDGCRPTLLPLPGVPHRVVRLVDACCDPDPLQRPSMADVLRMLRGEDLSQIREQRRNAWVAVGVVTLAVGLGASRAR